MYQLNKYITLLCLLASSISYTQAAEYPQCNNMERDIFIPAIDDCTAYIYCNGEESFRDSCPDLTYFDAQSQECVFDDAGVCLATVTQEPTPQSITTQELELAEEMDHGDGELIVVEEESSNSAEATSSTVAPSTVAPSTVAPSSVAPPTVVPATRPRCDLEGDGFHAHPQRCEYYYRCLSGYLSIVRCPYNYGWDYAMAECRSMDKANCFSS